MNTTIVRPVYAVRLDRATGLVCEGFEYVGEATSREDAIAECIAEGHTVVIDGGLIEITPAEVLGDVADGWTVTVAA
jgi:hypothetical protein